MGDDDEFDPELERQLWIDTMIGTGRFATFAIIGKGGMGAVLSGVSS